ncbi:uncharacterized protein DFL_002600 [Arthrobotrys flagrans]|uniref:Uncharacterized protein n=1 Tax=Arthrobotrys flagrans TaxID=97331 RepID=A0A437AAY2_ARTFL|nr:hypothetical protein DFL_002600 [Arthrobotrys flagrans]
MDPGNREPIVHNTLNNEGNRIFMQAGVNHGHIFNINPGKEPTKIKNNNYDVSLDLPFPRNSRSSASVFALTGTGGMGKTQTALEYAYACHESRRFTAIFWVSAATEEAIRTSFVNIMQQIVEEQARAFWPESSNYRTIGANFSIPNLIDRDGKISSDPKTINDIQSALFRWFKLPATTFQGTTGVSSESAIKLLLQLAQRNSTESEVKHAMAVVEKLGFMPLAISHAGCFIHELNIPVSEYLQYYDKVFKEAQTKIPKIGWAYREDTSVTTWEVSFLEIQKQNEEAASLLLTCAYLNPNEIFETLWEDERSDAEFQIQQKSRFSLLASYSLINRNQSGAFSVHSIMHNWTRERGDDSDRLQAIGSAVRIIGKTLRREELSRSSKKWDGRGERRILGHAETLCKYLEYRFDEVLEQSTSVEDTLQAFDNIGLVFYHQGKYEEALKQYQKALVGREKALGKDHPDTLTIIHNIGSILQNQGKYDEALKQYQRALVGIEKALGKDHSDIFATIHNIGSVLENQGKYDETLKQYQRALVGIKKVLGKDYPDTLATIYNIGSVLKNQGKYDEALKQYQRALVGTEKVLGKDHPLTLATIHNIGSVLKNQGKYDEALKQYQRALVGREKALGKDHPDTLTTIHNIGSVLKNQGKYDEALEQYQRALVGREKALGKDHPLTLATVNAIASVSRKLKV